MAKQRVLAEWVQTVLVPTFSQGKRIPHTDLANLIIDQWQNRPPGVVEHGPAMGTAHKFYDSLRRDHIPSWIANGWLEFSKP